jgi:hypothetical protein
MRRLLTAMSVSLFSLGAALASTNTPPVIKNPSINLYKDSDMKSGVVEQVPLQQNLVVIYRKGNWIKVGDSANGQVGWVNRKQYREMLNAYYKRFTPERQTVFIQTNRTGSGDQAKESVIAYRNGKQLTTKEAEALYAEMKKQQQAQAQQIHRWVSQVHRMTPMRVYYMDPVFFSDDFYIDREFN